MKTITMYELLGMVKDGKAPKKIKYENREYYLYDNKSYLTTDKTRFFDHIYFTDLNVEVEILEEEPRDIEVCGSWFTKSEYDELAKGEEEKKIPEKLDIRQEKNIKNNWKWKVYRKEHSYNISTPQKIIADKLNEVLDYLKSKGE